MTCYVKHFLNIVFIIPLILLSCANIDTTIQKEATISSPSKYVPETEQHYTLQSGDVMDIKFYYNPDLNERVIIMPDGYISLQIVGEIKASGLTLSELDRLLSQKYSSILVKPEIAVILREYGGQKVYVGGEVTTQGIITLTGNMTAFQAVVNAGGFKETAQPADVIIISKASDGLPVARKVDLNKVLSGDSPDSDAYLHPYDIIYVPKSYIANVDKFVDQYINKIIPNVLSVGFSYSRYNGKQTGTIETVPAK